MVKQVMLVITEMVKQVMLAIEPSPVLISAAKTTAPGSGRDDHYPVYKLGIQQNSQFLTGYGYLKTAKLETGTEG